jgi:hypothetical protein
MNYTIDTEKFEDELDHYAKLTAERWEREQGVQEFDDIAFDEGGSWLCEPETLLNGLVMLTGWLYGCYSSDNEDVQKQIVEEICHRAKQIANYAD